MKPNLVSRGGSRGRVQGVRTPPWDDLRFSNTTGILQKKNYVVYPGAEVEQQSECTPSEKKSWIRPWWGLYLMSIDTGNRGISLEIKLKMSDNVVVEVIAAIFFLR